MFTVTFYWWEPLWMLACFGAGSGIYWLYDHIKNREAYKELKELKRTQPWRFKND